MDMDEPGCKASSSTDTLKDSAGASPKAAAAGEDIAEEEVVTMAAGDRFWKPGRLARSASQVTTWHVFLQTSVPRTRDGHLFLYLSGGERWSNASTL